LVLPQGQTWGLFGWREQLHTWGFVANPLPAPAADIPVIYHQLTPAAWTGPDIARVLDVDVYQGKFLVAVQTSNGTVVNYYDGVAIDQATAGTFLQLYQSKMYRLNATLLRFAGIGNPTVEDPNDVNYPGAGFIDLSDQDSDSQILVSMESYYDKMAIFSRFTTQLWKLDPDPASNVFGQLLRVGCLAPASTLQFGTGDVLFLSDTGVRSLRAINSSLAASVNDVGSPIDTLIRAQIRSVPNLAFWGQAVVQPVAGRYWLSIDKTIYVLSYYPSAKISAWSTFTVPWYVDYMTTTRNRVALRSVESDNREIVYLYGGSVGDVYDNTTMTVETAMMSAGEPTVRKKPISIDASLIGNFRLEAGMMTNNPSAKEIVGTLAGQTFSLQSIPYAGYGTHIGLRLSCSDAIQAKLSSAVVNFMPGDVK
jgi:hypothetical protein